MTARRAAWVEIDLGAIGRNVERLTGLWDEDTALMAVVKADGYGHGAERVARAALAAGASSLGVATVDEGVELREVGIDAPILLLSEAPEDAVGEVVESRLTPTVHSVASARAFSEVAQRVSRPVRFHVNVDTGMHRSGVPHEEAVELIVSLIGMPGLVLGGVYTHFATADVPADWDLQTQLRRFEGVLDGLHDSRIHAPSVHAANSAAAILEPRSRFDMVRCGISLYGLHPADSTREVIGLEPAMSVKGRLSRVERLGMGEGVSYGLTWRAGAPTTLATVPIGYADGVHRVMSNRMSVLVSGVRCPQVGVVTMDQLMVEIPGGVSAAPGDEFVILGRQGDEHVEMDELAHLAHTIVYETACAFGMRLERVYTPADS